MGRATRKSQAGAQAIANRELAGFIKYFSGRSGSSKEAIIQDCVQKFALQKKGALFSAGSFSVRFSASSSGSFSNTVLALSKLQKVDSKPFIVCLISPEGNSVFLANSTFIDKISHSSKDLTKENIKGSFNGTDILRQWKGIDNQPQNFNQLFKEHLQIGFDPNLKRIINNTNDIKPRGQKAKISRLDRAEIMKSPQRAADFFSSGKHRELSLDLDQRLALFQKEIALASQIKNTNTRGRVIEYLISSDNTSSKKIISEKLKSGQTIPPDLIETQNNLEDYARDFSFFKTATDIKTKLLSSHSNPKAYSIDKALEFLSDSRSVFLFYFVGIDKDGSIKTALTSAFQNNLLGSMELQNHWSGSNSRGHAQFNGQAITDILTAPDYSIDIAQSQSYLKKLLAL